VTVAVARRASAAALLAATRARCASFSGGTSEVAVAGSVRQCHLQSAQPTADATTTTAAAAAAEIVTEPPDYDDIHSAPPSSHCTLCTVGARRGLVALYGFAPRVTTSVGPGGLFCVILIRRPNPALGGYFIFVICA
jgi:hypothetical protein